MDTDVKIKIRLGKTGSGKTLDQNEEDVLTDLLDKQEVYTCYWVNTTLPNWHYFAPRDFDAIKNLRNATIVFDELRQSFDPRSWESETEEVRSFFELHRHRHNTIIGNTQDVSLVSKTVGIQTHEWILIEQISKGRFGHWIERLFKTESISVQKDFLTFQELKKMANGWELGEDVALNSEWERKNYRIKDIIHPELDSIKIEIVHRYCPRCAMRQGEQILAADTNKICRFDDTVKSWILKKKEFCPKHVDEPLEVRLSGMFDTDYEPETVEKELLFKPFVKKEIWSEYRGGLSVKQQDYKDFIEKTGIKKEYEKKI